MVIEETVVAGIAQSRYAISTAMHEILPLITPSLKPRYVRLAQLHLRITAALLAMRTAHLTHEVSGIVKAWGRPVSGMTSPTSIEEAYSEDISSETPETLAIPGEGSIRLTVAKHTPGYAW